MTRAPLTLLGGGVLLVITAVELTSVYEWSRGGLSMKMFAAAALGGVACCSRAVLLLVNCLLLIGYAGAVQRVMVTGDERFRDLFQDRGLWLSMVVARVLKYGIALLAMLPFVVTFGLPAAIGRLLHVGPLGIAAGALLSLAYVPVLVYIHLGFATVEEAVAVEGKRPIDALQRSWDVAEGNRVQLLIYSLVLGFTSWVGLLLCGVGYLVTKPWTTAAWYESYIRFALPAPEEGMWVDDAGAPVAAHAFDGGREDAL